MTSFSLDTAETVLSHPASPSSLPVLNRPLRNGWSHGRSYTVIALLAPVILGSLLLVYLHTAKTRFGLGRL